MIAVDCGPVSLSGDLTCNTANTTFGSEVLCECKKGYERSGNKSFHVRCDEDGNWTPPNDGGEPTCQSKYQHYHCLVEIFWHQ